MKLLVIEDDPALSRALCEALRAEGCAVDLARDGEDGLHLGETETYNAALVDLGLPKIDGLRIIAGWRASQRSLPVLVLTARDDWTSKVEGFKAGADDYLVKPVRIEEVIMRLRALALMGAVTAQVFLVLLPLRRLSRALAEVRAGRARSVPDRQPAEVADLVVELNALLAQNADQAEQARAHIGNLAHGLKTPLATLAAELRPDHDVDREALRALVERMDRRIAHHLRRARSAALLGGRHLRTRLAPQIDDLVLALSKIHADRALRFEVSIPAEVALACDAHDVNEMCGNLLDNACKWAAGMVAVSAERRQRNIVICVRDDGAGFGAAQVDVALRRGGRLDEVTPGSGFGLPITREIAALYGGDLSLTQQQPGLLVSLTLPAAD